LIEAVIGLAVSSRREEHSPVVELPHAAEQTARDREALIGAHDAALLRGRIEDGPRRARCARRACRTRGSLTDSDEQLGAALQALIELKEVDISSTGSDREVNVRLLRDLKRLCRLPQ
jgi:hypothetical protein